MPKVGDKHYGYNKAGYAAARAESALTGAPVEDTKNSYSVGGLLKTAEKLKGKKWKEAKGAGIAKRGAPYRVV